MIGWKRILIIVVVILAVVAFALASSQLGGRSVTTSTTGPPSQTTEGSAPNQGLNSTGAPSDLSQLKVLSISLVNTSIGSDLEFNVTFANSGTSQIYYLGSPIRIVEIPCSGATATEFIGGNTTATVVNSTSIIPGCPNPIPVGVGQSLSAQSSDCNSSATTLVPLSPGTSAHASNSLCGTPFKIVGSGVFEATLSVSWAPTNSDTYLASPYITSVTELFKVG